MVTPEGDAAGGGRESSGGIKLSEVTPQQILEHRDNVMSDDPVKQLHSTQHFRRLLSIGEFVKRAIFFTLFNCEVQNVIFSFVV